MKAQTTPRQREKGQEDKIKNDSIERRNVNAKKKRGERETHVPYQDNITTTKGTPPGMAMDEQE